MMKNRSGATSTLLLAGVILFLAVPAADAGTPDGPGSTGASYLNLPVSPRSIAMGGAGSAIDNTFALFYNPALIGSDGKRAIGLSHSEWIVDTRYDNLTATLPVLRKLAVGAGITYLYRPAIEGYDQFGPTGEEFKTNNYQAVLGVKFAPIPLISAGLNLKYFRENLGEWHAEGMAVDIGLFYRLERVGFSAGVSVQNIGPDVKFDSIDEPIPLTVRAGASQSFYLEGLNMRATIAADAVVPRYEELYVSTGAEVELQETLCVRAGYCSEKYRPGSGFSMGGGIKVSRHLSVDYAFSPYGELGNFHRLSVNLSR